MMRLLTILFFTFVMFSCKSEKVVENVPDFERELIGFGMAGPHPDSLVGEWEFNPFPFDDWHAKNLIDYQCARSFSGDTMTVCNFNLGYSVLKIYEDYFSDTAKSKFLISRELDLFRFEKIEGREEMPERFYVKKYPNTLPIGFRYFVFKSFDVFYRMEFLIDSNNSMELIVQQRDNITSSNLNRF